MRLGRIPTPSLEFFAAPSHRFGAFPPPSSIDRSALSFEPELYHNDVIPNCTAVAYMNAARGIAALNGYDLQVEDDAAVKFYGECIGNPPDLANTDGAVPLDVLNYQITKGANIGYQELVARYGIINPASRSDLASGIARLGVGYWGVTLRDRDMQDFGTGRIWDVHTDDGPVIGGHMLIAWDYNGLADEDTVLLGTWGSWQPATWDWVANRVEESYGLVWRQLARTDGTFYSGLTADGLFMEL